MMPLSHCQLFVGHMAFTKMIIMYSEENVLATVQ